MVIQLIGMITLLIKWKLFAFLHLLVKCLNFLVIKFYLARNVSAEYGNSARVYKVLFRYKPHIMVFSNINNFIAVAEDLAHPEIVLKDDVSLYCINEREAVFVDCGAEDVFDSSHHTFVYNAQFDLSRKVICLPLASFYEVASNIKLPNIPLVHLPNHGRCGSTLLTKLIEAIPDTLSVSETSPYTDIAMLSQKGVVKRDVLKKMCYSTIMCTIKHCNSRHSKLLFLKGQHLVTYITDVMMEVVPEIKHIYMYRQPIPFVRSWEKLLFANNWDFFNEEMCSLASGFGHNEILKDYPIYEHDYLKKLSSFSKVALIWVTGIAAFNKLVSNGYPITSIKYEEMLSNPKRALLSIFKHLSIDETSLPDIDTVMSKDSQADSEFSSKHVDKKKLEAFLTPLSKELIDEVNELCQDFNAPLFWDDIRLDNSVICNDF